MSQPKIACVNCINWIPPFITSTGKLIDATCKVEKCCPLYINRTKYESYNTRQQQQMEELI